MAPWGTESERGFSGGTSSKESACQCRRCKRCGFDPWVGKIPWRRAWQPNLVFLPGKSHGQRSLVGYSPWGLKEFDTTECLSTAQHIITFNCLTDKTLRYKTVLHPLQSLLHLGTTLWSLWIWCLSLVRALLWTWTQALLLVL